LINTWLGDSFVIAADGRQTDADTLKSAAGDAWPRRAAQTQRQEVPPSWLDMWSTCQHAEHMSKMVQIRNVPDALHRKLKARAAAAGQSLSDYLLAEIGRIAALPTREEMLARLHSRTRVTLKTPAAVVIREERESA
jgi:antitoxin FitA